MKTAVVTGASSGIGKEITKHFFEQGWKVFALARRGEKLLALRDTLGDRVVPVLCDLKQPESITFAIKDIIQNAGAVDTLINNAGVFLPGSVDQETDAVWEEHFMVNLMGPVRLTRGLWPHFVAQKSGTIVNISSTLGLRPIANTGAYSALKSALNSWTMTLALEGAPHKIRANAICPGLVDTPIHPFHGSDSPEHIEARAASQSIQPLQRIGQPSDIAPLAYHLADAASAWTTGAVIPVDGGILLNS